MGAASPAYAAVVQGIPWVGPAGSGAPFEVDPAVGAQQAINDALATVGQGAVFVTGGTYSLKAPIVLGDRQSLVGTGPLSTLLRAASGFTGTAMVQTPTGTFTGSRMSIRDIGFDGANLVANGINLQISASPSSYGPDPAPWLSRVFVAKTTGDGIYLGGDYSGGQREFKVTDCRVEHAGGWAYHFKSSDGFVSGCSAQGGKLGGYNLAGGNIKIWGSKVYSAGTGDTPGPGFRIGSARATVVGCEAQDTRGCGFEVYGHGSNLSGCTADSTGIGDPGTDRYSAGFYVASSAVNIEGVSYQRTGGGGSWIPAKGMMWSLYLAPGVDYVAARLIGDPNRPTPYLGGVYGTAGSHSSITVLV
ncbi:right-handed parallel beta-helix repeat-containing protein [Micromonospora sonneratiae]|uniref:Right-handed parallel beta-helix repeat-containing protein n=1 Tax=Micromonospora sonneratiae TaxID=1184706 RepID=A0ABW3YRE1_9ACTN